jgi:hypothetical protein
MIYEKPGANGLLLHYQGPAYPSGDSSSTIKLIEYLRNFYPNHPLILIEDGVSYHHSLEVKPYLAKLNQGSSVA